METCSTKYVERRANSGGFGACFLDVARSPTARSPASACASSCCSSSYEVGGSSWRLVRSLCGLCVVLRASAGLAWDSHGDDVGGSVVAPPLAAFDPARREKTRPCHGPLGRTKSMLYVSAWGVAGGPVFDLCSVARQLVGGCERLGPWASRGVSRFAAQWAARHSSVSCVRLWASRVDTRSGVLRASASICPPSPPCRCCLSLWVCHRRSRGSPAVVTASRPRQRRTPPCGAPPVPFCRHAAAAGLLSSFEHQSGRRRPSHPAVKPIVASMKGCDDGLQGSRSSARPASSCRSLAWPGSRPAAAV